MVQALCVPSWLHVQSPALPCSRQPFLQQTRMVLRMRLISSLCHHTLHATCADFHNQWNVHFGEGTWGMAWQEAYRRFFGGKQANLYGETWDWALCNA